MISPMWVMAPWTPTAVPGFSVELQDADYASLGMSGDGDAYGYGKSGDGDAPKESGPCARTRSKRPRGTDDKQNFVANFVANYVGDST